MYYDNFAVLNPEPEQQIAYGYLFSANECEFLDRDDDDIDFDALAPYELDEELLLRKLRKKHYSFRLRYRSSYYVSDGIGDDYKDWTVGTCAFISAQTGRGKNTFVKKELIRHVKDDNWKHNTNYKILIFSNRIALNKQVKRQIEGSGVATVISYQSFLNFSKYNKHLEAYKYVVFDECHFFTSDAMFNPETKAILHEAIRRFQDAVRIYMSSTLRLNILPCKW